MSSKKIKIILIATFTVSILSAGIMWKVRFEKETGKDSEIFATTATINGEDATYDNPLIPAGFRAINEGNAIWNTKEGYQYGLVIEDEKQNQFVWIPVDGKNIKLNRYLFKNDGTPYPVNADKIIDTGYYELVTYQELTESPYGNSTFGNLESFFQSVEENGGYYLGRYEASYGGILENGEEIPLSRKSTTAQTSMFEKNKNAIGILWNRISQKDAAKISKNMYINNPNVTSDLVNSYAYDTALVFIQKYSDCENYSQTNYSNENLINTGESNDLQCNIFDMSGNLMEWTTETSDYEGFPNVPRGGHFGYNDNKASLRISSESLLTDSSIGFRVLLYL